MSNYLTIKAFELNGFIDLNDHRVEHVLTDPVIGMGFRALPADTSFFEAIKVLKEPKTRVVVAIDQDQGTPVGVMVRAHRRY